MKIIKASQSGQYDEMIVDLVDEGFDRIRNKYGLSEDQLTLDDIELEALTSRKDWITVYYTLDGTSGESSAKWINTRPPELDGYEDVGKICNTVDWAVQDWRYDQDRAAKKRALANLAAGVSEWWPQIEAFVEDYCHQHDGFDVELHRHDDMDISIRPTCTPAGRQIDKHRAIDAEVGGREFRMFVDYAYVDKDSVQDYSYESILDIVRSRLDYLLSQATTADQVIEDLESAVNVANQLERDLNAMFPEVATKIKLYPYIDLSYMQDSDVQYRGVVGVAFKNGADVGRPIEFSDIFALNLEDLKKKIKAKLRRAGFPDRPAPNRSLMK